MFSYPLRADRGQQSDGDIDCRSSGAQHQETGISTGIQSQPAVQLDDALAHAAHATTSGVFVRFVRADDPPRAAASIQATARQGFFGSSWLGLRRRICSLSGRYIESYFTRAIEYGSDNIAYHGHPRRKVENSLYKKD